LSRASYENKGAKAGIGGFGLVPARKPKAKISM